MIGLVVTGLTLLGGGYLVKEAFTQKKESATGKSSAEQKAAYEADVYQRTEFYKAFGEVAQTLDQGKKYGLKLFVDPKDPTFGGIRDLATAQQLIKATFEQLGWKFATMPMLATKEDLGKLSMGQPTQFVAVAMWNRPEKFMPTKPNWLTMALPYSLPTK